MSNESRGSAFVTGFFIGVVAMFLLCLYLLQGQDKVTRADAYRQGQIDAISGKVRYRPVARVEWEEAKP